MSSEDTGEARSPDRPRTRTRTINIDGMKGEECVSRVTRVLRGLAGLDVASVTVGAVTLRSATMEEARTAFDAIKDAGFEPRRSRPPRLDRD